MKKTLRSVIAVPIIVGSLLLPGCGKRENTYEKTINLYEKTLDNYKEALKIAQNQGSISEGNKGTVEKESVPEISKPKTIQNNLGRTLENYFFQKEELGVITLSDKKIDDEYSNPVVFTKNPNHLTEIDRHIQGPNNQHEGGDGSVLDPNRVLKVGLAKYEIPRIENDSETRDLLLEIVEFESEKYRNSFIERTKEYLSGKVVLAKDNMMFVIVEPTIQDALKNLSDEQRTIYGTLVEDYAKRIGVKQLVKLREVP